MPHGRPLIGIGILTRKDDGYSEAVTLETDGAIRLSPQTAIRIAAEIKARADEVLSQSAAACGCDVKADWICERHTPIEGEEIDDEEKVAG